MKKLFILLFCLLAVSGAFPQWITPPYKITTYQPSEDFRFYLTETDLNNDGKLEIAILDGKSFKFFESDFSIIDAANVRNDNDRFAQYRVIKNDTGNLLLVSYYSLHRVELWAVKIRANKTIYQKVFYSFYTGRETPNIDMKYLAINKNLSIIFLSTVYPLKHDFRRIIAINPNTFDIIWERFSADYISDSEYFPEIVPGAFYFTTSGYFNQLYFSNNTFYMTDDEKDETYIDTSFTSKIYPKPDSKAEDYSTDSSTYLVKMSLSGNILWRKRIGGRFTYTWFRGVVSDSISIIAHRDRRKNRGRFLKFFLKSDSLSELSYSALSPEESYYVEEGNDFLYLSQPGKFSFISISNDSLLIDRTVQLTDNVLINSIIGKYYIGQSKEERLYFFDSNFTQLGNIAFPRERFTLKWSVIFNKIVLDLPNNAKLIEFHKTPFYARISNEGARLLLFILFGAIIILLVFWVLTMRISKKKISEHHQELHLKHKELEMATAKLLHAEKLAALGTVAASFAHQLNSPIGAIMNSSQRLMGKVKDDNLDLILQSAEHCKSVIRRFLIASRTQRNDESTCCEFNEIWDNWRELFKDEFTNYKINFISNFSHSENRLAISASEFQEILSNILFNARDSIIEADKDEKYIKISTCDNGSFLNIVIEDSGTGFDEKIMDNLFDAFITTKKEGVGTGLGLWITKKLLDKVGGNISISNSADGAIINLDVPYCK